MRVDQFAVAVEEIGLDEEEEEPAFRGFLLVDVLVARLEPHLLAVLGEAIELDFAAAIEQRAVGERQRRQAEGGRADRAVEMRVLGVFLHQVALAEGQPQHGVGKKRRRDRLAVARAFEGVVPHVDGIDVHDGLGIAAHGAALDRVAGELQVGLHPMYLRISSVRRGMGKVGLDEGSLGCILSS